MPKYTKYTCLFNNLRHSCGMISLLFFLICISGLAMAADSGKDSILTEKEIGFVRHRYRSGSYEEAAGRAVRLLNRLEKSKESGSSRQMLKVRLLLARIYEARLLFDKAKETVDAAKAFAGADKDNSPLAYLCLGEYFAETGRYIEAAEMYEQGVSSGPATSYERLRYELLEAEIALGKGFNPAALKYLLDQESTWLRMVSGKDLSEGREISVLRDREVNEKYVRFLNLKTLAYLRNGKPEEAEKNSIYSKEWISRYFGKKSPEYSRALETEIFYDQALEKEGRITSLYAEAYFLHPASDYEEEKIYLLCMNALHSLNIGDLIAFEKFLRKLQMNASQYLGKNDLSHFAYEFILSYQAYHNGNCPDALASLEELTARFSFLPSYHRFAKLSERLRADIYLRGWMLSDYKKSLEKAVQQSSDLAGGSSPVTQKARLESAMFEVAYGADLKQAENIFLSAYYGDLIKNAGSKGPDNLVYLQSLSDLYYKTGRFDSAVAASGRMQELTASIHGVNTLQHTLAKAMYSYYLLAAGKPEEVLNGFSSLLQNEKELPYNRLTRTKRAELLYLISEIARLTGEVELSREYSFRSLSLFDNYTTVISPSGLRIWEQAASLNMQTANYYKAESLLKKSLDFKSKYLGENSPLLLPVYSALGSLYTTTGNYGEADRYLRLFSKKAEELTGTNSMFYSESQFLSGDYYAALGDLETAEEKYRNSIRLQASLLGKDHLLLASPMMQLASVSAHLYPENTEENEKIYRKAGTIISEAIGTGNAFYAEYLQRSAAFYIYSGKYQEAITMLEEADRYWREKLGAANKYSADIAALQGDAAYRLTRYEEAGKKYQEAAKLYADIFGKQHPLYAAVTGKTARVYYMMDDVNKSFRTIEEVIPVYLEYTEKYFSSLSFSDKERFWNNLKEEFEFYNFLALGKLSGSRPQLSSRVYDQLISTKALLLSSDIKLRKTIAASGDTALVRLFDEWVEKKEFITASVSIPQRQLIEQGISLDKEIGEMERLEKLMSNRSNAFNETRKKRNIRWQDIQDQLSETEYAVEFLRFRHFDQTFTDSVIYAALVLNKSGAYPELVLMPNGNEMEGKYLNYYRNTVALTIKDKKSYEVFWKPVKSLIPDSSTIYLSSDGVYYQINPEMIYIPDKDAYVMDVNSIIFVTNTKDLLNGKEGRKEKRRADDQENYFICGNPDFFTKGNKGDVSGKIPPLPGAENEVIGIHNLLKSSGKNSVYLLGADVTEDTLKQLYNPAVLHIATHGYFMEGEEYSTNTSVANPLLNSGLILYGGGDIIGNPENKYVNSQPGILTAYEALNLNFDHTQLVVLSACETARGKIKAGEGVYGLQRSFLIAGADAVIMSLFRVNDEITGRFMIVLYENLIRSGDKRYAFLTAKETIKKEYGNPIFWGSFIMIETNPKAE